MDTHNAFDSNTQAVSADLRALQWRLKEAVDVITAACEHIQLGDRNRAIDRIAGLDVLLSEAKSLYAGAVALHRPIPARPAEAERRAPAPLSTLEAIRRRYPNMKPWVSPGGCFSLRHPCSDGGYLSLAEPLDGLQSPDVIDDTAALGAFEVERYDANGEIVEPACLVPFERISEWIDAALGRASAPETVADYVLKQLGVRPVDLVLSEQPIASPCGERCVKAIDAAADLIRHVRAAFGGDVAIRSAIARSGGNLELGVVEIARRVVSIYCVNSDSIRSSM